MRRARRTGLALGAAVSVLAPWGGSAARGETPRINYMLQCQGCHLADGAGAPGSVPDLRDSIGRLARVPRGRAYLVGVPGSAQSSLADAELAEVLNWMVRAFGPAEGVAPFTREEVARHRQPLLDVDAARREVLRELDPGGAP